MRQLLRSVVSLLLLMFLLSYAIAQNQSLKGTVTGSGGIPLSGATIRIKNSTITSLTDANGNFTITAANGQVLEISYVGYQTLELTVSGTEPLIVALRPAKSDLEEVVVVGYGTQKKKLVTGATVQVKGEDIARLNTVDVLGAFSRRLPV
ncbi:carboxypeptidase-like regulatory domain-containing protein [Pseudobacter ginsenosidimutans]|uniref:carboxypeptidase-like regulatory domain-containing protein n=1 Tax=Pseudobacter ginsenosidimutans TaxID=661488 RepID=UPI001CEF93ED|nr:carboxypeptidase-like regulatory domain-containing protein [Pseudobacter ginsenosidimutans]